MAENLSGKIRKITSLIFETVQKGERRWYQYFEVITANYNLWGEEEGAMTIEIRLLQLLHKYKIFKHGIETEMAEKCGLHRHTIGKMLRNEARNPSLNVLDKICGYLIDNGVPSEILPGAVLGFKPATIWKSISQLNRVAIYIGMYVHIKKNNQPGPAHMTVARHDATAVAKVNLLLTSKAELGDQRPSVKTWYVPFQFHPATKQVDGDWFETDKRYARGIFEDMLKRGSHESSIILGSQRVNYLVEYLVAELFGCIPFQSINKKPKVPFYLCYRDFDRPVPSCFGGMENPLGVKGPKKSGIWYLDNKGKWQLDEWEMDRSGAGIIITIRQMDSMVMALFGLSGRSTYAICNELIVHPQKFWIGNDEDKTAGAKRSRSKNKTVGNIVTRHNKEIGVHICNVKFTRPEKSGGSWTEKDYEGDEVEVKLLASSMLDRYLPKKGRS
jgi:transcriptional regulator with XRE-family HTH domain